ncbi:MAG: hypothetical protein ACP5EN_00485 [Rhodovulum sp.]
MVDQQIRMMQIFTDAMIRSNPWLRLMLHSGGIDPLTADAAVGKGDETNEIDLEAGGAEAEVASARLQAIATEKPTRKPATDAGASPARKPAAKWEPGTARSRKRATPAPRHKASASADKQSKSRARRKPSAPPPLPASGPQEPKK